MQLGAVGGSSLAALQQGTGPPAAVKQAFQDLEAAVGSGNLDDAKKALTKLDQAGPPKDNLRANPMSDKMDALKKAVEAGDVKAAQSAWADLKQGLAQGPQGGSTQFRMPNLTVNAPARSASSNSSSSASSADSYVSSASSGSSSAASSTGAGGASPVPMSTASASSAYRASASSASAYGASVSSASTSSASPSSASTSSASTSSTGTYDAGAASTSATSSTSSLKSFMYAKADANQDGLVSATERLTYDLKHPAASSNYLAPGSLLDTSG